MNYTCFKLLFSCMFRLWSANVNTSLLPCLRILPFNNEYTGQSTFTLHHGEAASGSGSSSSNLSRLSSAPKVTRCEKNLQYHQHHESRESATTLTGLPSWWPCARQVTIHDRHAFASLSFCICIVVVVVIIIIIIIILLILILILNVWHLGNRC